MKFAFTYRIFIYRVQNPEACGGLENVRGWKKTDEGLGGSSGLVSLGYAMFGLNKLFWGFYLPF